MSRSVVPRSNPAIFPASDSINGSISVASPLSHCLGWEQAGMARLPTLRWLPFLIGSDREHPPRTGTWHRTPERPILKIRASRLPVRLGPDFAKPSTSTSWRSTRRPTVSYPPQSRQQLQKLYCAYNNITVPSFILTGAPTVNFTMKSPIGLGHTLVIRAEIGFTLQVADAN